MVSKVEFMVSSRLFSLKCSKSYALRLSIKTYFSHILDGLRLIDQVTKSQQDGSGWTPLMIAVSLKDREDLVDLFLRKEADVDAKS